MNFKKAMLLISTLVVVAMSHATTEQKYKEIDKLIANNEITHALRMVNTALKEAASDPELLMRKSRIITIQGDQNSNEDLKVRSYEIAQKVATELIEKHPDSPKGYLRRAIAKGKLILYKGILQSRSLVLELRKDAKKALSISTASAYEKALASYLLGRAHLKLATKPKALRMPLGLAWASNSKGGEYLKNAAEGYPSSVAFNLDYALYLKKNDKKEEAKKLFMKIDSLEVFDPADVERKARAKKELSNL